jgi:hypothetical protein
VDGAIGRVHPIDVVAVVLDGEFDRAGSIDVDDVIDAGQRQRASAIEIEVGFEVPVACGRQQIEPHRHGLGAGRTGEARAGAGARIGRILAVHGGVPEAAAETGVLVVGGGVGGARNGVGRSGTCPTFLGEGDAGRFVELMLDGPDGGIGGSIRGEIHPAIVEQRRRGDARAGGARVLVRVELLEQPADFFEQRARAGVVSRIPRDPAR